MAVSALYTGSALSARHDGVKPLGELVNGRAAPAEVLGRLERGAETTGDLVASDWTSGRRRQRRSKNLERRYHVPPLAAGDADAADRPGGQADRMIDSISCGESTDECRPAGPRPTSKG